MTKRKTNMHIEKHWPYDHKLDVYTDLSKHQLKSIEGVARVESWPDTHFIVTVDKRYSTKQVWREIETMHNLPKQSRRSVRDLLVSALTYIFPARRNVDD